jgi:hypothetical protein
MSIPNLEVTVIKSEGVEAWTVVTVEFEWLDGVYCGNGQWPDAVDAAALALESEAWRAYWQRPHFVQRELYDGGPLCRVAVERPESAREFSSWCLNRRGGWVSCYSR